MNRIFRHFFLIPAFLMFGCASSPHYTDEQVMAMKPKMECDGLGTMAPGVWKGIEAPSNSKELIEQTPLVKEFPPQSVFIDNFWYRNTQGELRVCKYAYCGGKVIEFSHQGDTWKISDQFHINYCG